MRYWAVSSLGVYWNTRVIVVPGTRIVNSGPYKFFRHTNYAAVITEIAVIPLIFGCYYTAAVFTLINLFVLRRRIGIEESALKPKSSDKFSRIYGT
jgi:methyltransferase